MTDDLISRQQAIDMVHKNYDTILDFTSDGRTMADSFEDIINTLPSIQSEQRWIPVTERLPEKSGYYLATVDIGWKIVDVIFFNNGSGFLMANTVKAWKPTPEPYQGVSKNE